MNCRSARTRMQERSLQGLSAAGERALREHWSVCAGCAAEHLVNERITDALGALRSEYPAHIDVTARVAAAIGPLETLNRSAVPGRQIGWATMIAASLAAISLFALGNWVASPEVMTTIRGLLRTIGGLVAPFAATLLTLISVPFKLLAVMLEALSALIPRSPCSNRWPWARCWPAYSSC